MTVPVQRGGDTDSVPVTLARLEGKLDAALAQHGARLDNHTNELSDHESRLRLIESRPAIPEEAERRLRAVEERPTVSPKSLWAAVASAAAVFAVVSPLLERLYSLHP